MKLHISVRSPFARRIRLTLEELGIPYEACVTDVFKPTAAYLAVNPLGRVPALELDSGEVIADSNGIRQWLRDRHGSHALFSTRGFSDAQTIQWGALAVGAMEWTVTWFLESLKSPGMRDADTLEEAEGAVLRAFSALNSEVALRQKYLAGDTIGVWDLDVGTAYAYAKFRMNDVVGSRFPALEGYLGRLMERESFKKTAPKI